MPNKGKSTRSKAASSKKKSVRKPAAKKTSTRSASAKGTSSRSTAAAKDRAKKLKDIKKTLVQRRADISQGMEHNLDYNDAPPLSRGDASDLAADALDSDTTLQLAERGSNEVSQIEEALNKIADGTYGECGTCGEQIPWSRLQALPYATLCVKCKEQQEREGGGMFNGPGWGGVDELEDMEGA